MAAETSIAIQKCVSEIVSGKVGVLGEKKVREPKIFRYREDLATLPWYCCYGRLIISVMNHWLPIFSF